MDPNVLWNDLLEWADELVRDESNDNLYAYEIAMKVLDMDEWLCKGGFPPARWKEARA